MEYARPLTKEETSAPNGANSTAEPNKAAAADKDTYTVSQFCSRHNISRTLFYKLLSEGRGPVLMHASRRPLISRESAADWRRRMEEEASPPKQVQELGRRK